MTKHLKLVRVKWRDAKSEPSGWKSIEEIRNGKAALVSSVGWIIKETKKDLILVSSIVDDHCDGDVIIPRDWVQSIEELTVKR